MIFPVQNNVFLLTVYSLLLIYHLITETSSLIDEDANRIIQEYQRQCGLQKSQSGTKLYPRVVHSVQVPNSDKWPWMALVERSTYKPEKNDPTKLEKFFELCGGTLVGPRHILTAAHCSRGMTQEEITLKRLRVYMGDTNREMMQYKMTSTGYDVISIHRYQAESLTLSVSEVIEHDIAILVLNRDVTISSSVIPICLPTEEQSKQIFSKPYFANTAYLAGWGSQRHITKEDIATGNIEFPEILRDGVTHIHQNEECLKKKISIKSYHICIFGGETMIGRGDSGGPLMVAVPSEGHKLRWIQIGLIFAAIDKETELYKQYGQTQRVKHPELALRVPYYMDWIRKTILKTTVANLKLLPQQPPKIQQQKQKPGRNLQQRPTPLPNLQPKQKLLFKRS